MRVSPLAAAFAALIAASLQPASAQAPKPKPAAKPDPVAQSYAAMPEAERAAILTDLMWTGDFLGTAAGEFGPRSIAAVKAFQKKLATKETGVLNPKERAELAAAARKKREAVGWRVVTDGATGVRLGLPGKLAPQASTIAGGSRWASARGEIQVETFRIAAPGTTLAQVYERNLNLPNRKASYKVLRPNFFVVSGLQAGVKKFYVRGEFKDGQVRGFTILYDQAMELTVDPVVIAMSSAFAAFPAAAVAAGPPPRRKVEYGTAVFVDAAGAAVTTQGLVDGCTVVTLAGHGPAEVVATDKAANLALLRLYGPHTLAPIGLAPQPAAGVVTLAGIADPQAQGGGGATSVMRARTGGSAERPALDPVPGLGFEGAAAIDVSGRLAGIVDLPLPQVAGPPPGPPQAALIGAPAIRNFLAANKVTPADSARTGVEAQKAAVARVICVRK